MIVIKKLPTQLRCGGERPVRASFDAPRNYGEERRGGFMKPSGGIWTCLTGSPEKPSRNLERRKHGRTAA